MLSFFFSFFSVQKRNTSLNKIIVVLLNLELIVNLRNSHTQKTNMGSKIAMWDPKGSYKFNHFRVVAKNQFIGIHLGIKLPQIESFLDSHMAPNKVL